MRVVKKCIIILTVVACVSAMFTSSIMTKEKQVKAAETLSVIREESAIDRAQEHEEKIYGIGSVSKMFTTVAVLKLVEEGKINLDTPVFHYLPEFKMEDERYQKITPLMLLNHTSGLLGTINHNAFDYGKDDTSYHDTFLETLSHQKLKANPGEYSVYCNDGFTLAELLVERVSGMSFSTYVKKEISEPLGLDDTFTPVEGFTEENIARITMDGHTMPYMNCHCLGSGGLYSTTEDVARFGQIFTKSGRKILSEESIELMQRAWYQNDAFGVCEGDNQMGYGLGWDCVDMYPYNIYGIKALSKGGDIIGYHANLTVLPEHNISIAINSAGEDNVVAGEIAQDIILQVLLEEGIIHEVKESSVNPKEKIEAKALPKEYLDYAGYYISNNMIDAQFEDNGTLVLRAADSDFDMVGKFIYTGNGEFVSSSGVYLNQYGFAMNSNGNYGKTILKFVKENNGKTYLKAKMYETNQGIGETIFQMLIGEKVENQVLPDQISEAWNQRLDHKYYLVNEGYNSAQYIIAPYVKTEPIQGMNGYIKSFGSNKPCKIIDQSIATSEMSLPGMLGRDLVTYSFESKDDYEVLHVNELTYISEDAMLSSSQLQNQVIVSDDMAVWYRIDDEDASKLIQIHVPENCAYYVYDEEDQCIASSIYVDEVNSVVLPKNGSIVFVGAPGCVFDFN